MAFAYPGRPSWYTSVVLLLLLACRAPELAASSPPPPFRPVPAAPTPPLPPTAQGQALGARGLDIVDLHHAVPGSTIRNVVPLEHGGWAVEIDDLWIAWHPDHARPLAVVPSDVPWPTRREQGRSSMRPTPDGAWLTWISVPRHRLETSHSPRHDGELDVAGAQRFTAAEVPSLRSARLWPTGPNAGVEITWTQRHVRAHRAEAPAAGRVGASPDGLSMLMDTDAGLVLRTANHDHAATTCREASEAWWRPDAKVVACRTSEGMAIYDAVNGHSSAHWLASERGTEVDRAWLAPHTQRVALRATEGHLLVWAFSTNHTWTTPLPAAAEVVWTADERHIIVWSETELRVLDARTGKPATRSASTPFPMPPASAEPIVDEEGAEWRFHGSTVTRDGASVSVTAEGVIRALAVDEKHLTAWHLDGSAIRWPLPPRPTEEGDSLQPHPWTAHVMTAHAPDGRGVGKVKDLAVSDDGRHIAVAWTDSLALFDLQGEMQQHVRYLPDIAAVVFEGPTARALDADGWVLASATPSGAEVHTSKRGRIRGVRFVGDTAQALIDASWWTVLPSGELVMPATVERNDVSSPGVFQRSPGHATGRGSTLPPTLPSGIPNRLYPHPRPATETIGSTNHGTVVVHRTAVGSLASAEIRRAGTTSPLELHGLEDTWFTWASAQSLLGHRKGTLFRWSTDGGTPVASRYAGPMGPGPVASSGHGHVAVLEREGWLLSGPWETFPTCMVPASGGLLAVSASGKRAVWGGPGLGLADLDSCTQMVPVPRPSRPIAPQRTAHPPPDDPRLQHHRSGPRPAVSGERWVVAGENGLLLWTGRRLLQSPTDATVTAIAFSPDEQHLLWGHADGSVQVERWTHLLDRAKPPAKDQDSPLPATAPHPTGPTDAGIR